MKKLTFQNDILPLKDRLFRLALRITANRQDAEDVVQETMLKLWRQRERWDEIENIEQYSLKACRNIALDHQDKADNNVQSIEEENPGTLEQSLDPYQRMFHQERLNMVRDTMARLPEKQRTAMHLRDFEGKAYQEIAEIMNITEDQVKVNIFRARKFIKENLTTNN